MQLTYLHKCAAGIRVYLLFNHAGNYEMIVLSNVFDKHVIYQTRSTNQTIECECFAFCYFFIGSKIVPLDVAQSFSLQK